MFGIEYQKIEIKKMRKIIVIFALLFCFSCNNASQKSETNTLMSDIGDMPTMTFQEISHDFGKMTSGDVVEYKYKFKNTGDAPLVINSVVAGCGCTIPSWNKSPIAVGQEDEILVRFNSENKEGTQKKFITITSNAGENELSFTADVLPKIK